MVVFYKKKEVAVVKYLQLLEYALPVVYFLTLDQQRYPYVTQIVLVILGIMMLLWERTLNQYKSCITDDLSERLMSGCHKLFVGSLTVSVFFGTARIIGDVTVNMIIFPYFSFGYWIIQKIVLHRYKK